jgi:glycerol kinase
VAESTAKGAAWLAGMQIGAYPDMAGFAATWEKESQFTPKQDDSWREGRYAGWKKAINATLAMTE